VREREGWMESNGSEREREGEREMKGRREGLREGEKEEARQ
jgi:hypothetical protein